MKGTLAQKMKSTCQSIDGFIYELPSKRVYEDTTNRLATYEIGEKGPASGTGKVLMLVGATGAGKVYLPLNKTLSSQVYLHVVLWHFFP